MGETLGGGGRGAHRWRGGARWSRKRRSSAGGGAGWRMKWPEVGRAARNGGVGGVRAGSAGWNGRAAGGRRGVGWAGGTRRVRRAVRGRSGGRAGVHLARRVNATKDEPLDG
jgi:hypothetical protein